MFKFCNISFFGIYLKGDVFNYHLTLYTTYYINEYYIYYYSYIYTLK